MLYEHGHLLDSLGWLHIVSVLPAAFFFCSVLFWLLATSDVLNIPPFSIPDIVNQLTIFTDRKSVV